jgi:hypothetical protein
MIEPRVVLIHGRVTERNVEGERDGEVPLKGQEKDGDEEATRKET